MNPILQAEMKKSLIFSFDFSFWSEIIVWEKTETVTNNYCDCKQNFEVICKWPLVILTVTKFSLNCFYTFNRRINKNIRSKNFQ